MHLNLRMNNSPKPVFRSYRTILFMRFVLALFILLTVFVWPHFGLYPFEVGGIIFFVGVLPILLEILSLPLKLEKIKENNKIQIDSALNFFRRRYIVTILVLTIIFCSPLYIESVIELGAENNRGELTKIVNRITENSTNDIAKTKSILAWFDRSKEEIRGIYGKDLLFEIYPIFLFTEKPYFCVRIIGHNAPLWVLSSRCGACEENSLLFSAMADAANLTVRSIHNHGENHNWDEVFINGSWVIIDPGNVDLARGRDGFNLSARLFEEGRNLNISYVFAEYPDGTRKDVTQRYTNVSSITFIAWDNEENPAPNVTLTIFSNNWMPNFRTDLNCTTDYEGKCNLSLGGGSYTITAKNDDFVPLCGKHNCIIEENKGYEENLFLSPCLMETQIPFRDIFTNILPTVLCLSIVISMWVSIVFYLEFRRIK